jgi:hypothetical protein
MGEDCDYLMGRMGKGSRREFDGEWWFGLVEKPAEE